MLDNKSVQTLGNLWIPNRNPENSAIEWRVSPGFRFVVPNCEIIVAALIVWRWQS